MKHLYKRLRVSVQGQWGELVELIRERFPFDHFTSCYPCQCQEKYRPVYFSDFQWNVRLSSYKLVQNTCCSVVSNIKTFRSVSYKQMINLYYATLSLWTDSPPREKGEMWERKSKPCPVIPSVFSFPLPLPLFFAGEPDSNIAKLALLEWRDVLSLDYIVDVLEASLDTCFFLTIYWLQKNFMRQNRLQNCFFYYFLNLNIQKSG